MSYARISATAEAKRVLDEHDAERRAAERARITASSQRMMTCGLTCREWLDIYLKRNLPATVVEHNTESNHDDQDRREATGTQAGPVGAGEGVGDTPGEQGQGEARANSSQEGARPAVAARLDDPGNEASWIDDAYPEGQDPQGQEGADFTEADRTPF